MKNKYKLLLVIILISLIIFGLMCVTNQNVLHFPIAKIGNSSIKWIDATIPVQSNTDTQGTQSNANVINVHAVEPTIPPSIPLYIGILKEGDALFEEKGSDLTLKNSVPSEKEAPQIARNLLQQYGGLPVDAELQYSNIVYVQEVQFSTGMIIDQKPTDTDVVYLRKINGMPVTGAVDKIEIELGENGELLQISKVWRTLESIGNTTCIISPNDAVEKIQKREILDPPWSLNGISIDNISLGYYEISRTDPVIYLEPVWIFSGKDRQNDPISLSVSAGVTAHFVATHISNKSSLTTSFTGISSGAPKQWQWDFGDGTRAVGQNVTHTFAVPGNYTITLITGYGECRNLISKNISIPVQSELPHNTTLDKSLENSPSTINENNLNEVYSQ